MSSRKQVIWGAVVVAAGSAERFGGEDKLLATIGGRPVLELSIQAIADSGCFRDIVIVVNPDDEEKYREALREGCRSMPATYAAGGSTRSGSVRAGLNALSEDVTHVAVHDAARPLVPTSLIMNVVEAAERSGAAVPAVTATSTLAMLSLDGTKLAEGLDRSRICEIQTPQAGRLDLMRDAIDRFPDVTDESSALLRAGESVTVVPGSLENIKLTYPVDLAIARAIATSTRVGH